MVSAQEMLAIVINILLMNKSKELVIKMHLHAICYHSITNKIWLAFNITGPDILQILSKFSLKLILKKKSQGA